MWSLASQIHRYLIWINKCVHNHMARVVLQHKSKSLIISKIAIFSSINGLSAICLRILIVKFFYYAVWYARLVCIHVHLHWFSTFSFVFVYPSRLYLFFLWRQPFVFHMKCKLNGNEHWKFNGIKKVTSKRIITASKMGTKNIHTEIKRPSHY